MAELRKSSKEVYMESLPRKTEEMDQEEDMDKENVPADVDKDADCSKEPASPSTQQRRRRSLDAQRSRLIEERKASDVSTDEAQVVAPCKGALLESETFLMQAAKQRGQDTADLANFLKANGFTKAKDDDVCYGLPVDAGRRTGLFGATTYPLHVAVKQANAHMVSLLVERGASLSQMDSAGKTPLMLAQQLEKKSQDQALSDVVQVLRQAM